MMDTEPEANPAAEALEVSEKDAQTLVRGADELEAPEPYTPPEEEPDELDKMVSEEAPEGEPELVEVEYEGKQYKLDPALKDALLRQSDYTKKTMALADERKAFEAKAEQLDTLRGLSNERMQAVQQTLLIDAEIERIENTPAQGLTEEQLARAEARLGTLRHQRGQWQAYGQQAAQAEKGARDQQFAKDRDAALAEAAKLIPNFNDDRRAQLAELVASEGGNPEMVNSIADPLVWKFLHLADIGKRFTERQRKAAQAKAAHETQPAPQVSGKSSSKTAPDQMSPGEMDKFLKSQGVI